MRSIAKTLSQKNGKKNASQEFFGLISLINSFASYAHGLRICLLETVIFLKLRKKKKKFLGGNETAANEPTLKMWLINSYLAFIFVFHFSKSRQRYCNLVCTKRKRERKKERKEDWWNSKRQNLQRSIYFRYFTDLETRFLEMMMVERYLGA